MKNKILKKLKVLLIEDEEKLARLLKGAIGDRFHSFSLAYNGEEGLEKFFSISPDIVITDINMPNMSGLEMAREIKSQSPATPVIILSAFSETDKFLSAIDIGVVKYFIKPFDPDELLAYIESISDNFDSKIIELVDGFSFNKSTNSMYKNGRYISLSKKEILFMEVLLQSPYNTNVGTELIKSKLWIDENVSDTRVRTFIKRLREKTSKSLIVNNKGDGYHIATLSPDKS